MLSFCHCQFYALQKFLFPSATCYGQDSSDRLSVPVSNTRLWSWFWFVDDNSFWIYFWCLYQNGSIYVYIKDDCYRMYLCRWIEWDCNAISDVFIMIMHILLNQYQKQSMNFFHISLWLPKLNILMFAFHTFII